MLTCVDIDIVVTYVTTRRHTKICLCFQCALSTRSTARHVTRLAAFVQPRPAVSLKASQKAKLVENSFQFAREINPFLREETRFSTVDFGFTEVASVCTGATAISITSTNIRVKNKIIKSRLRFETRPMFGIDVAVFVFGSQISSERNSTDVWLLATNFHPLSQRMHFATSVYLAVPSF